MGAFYNGFYSHRARAESPVMLVDPLDLWPIKTGFTAPPELRFHAPVAVSRPAVAREVLESERDQRDRHRRPAVILRLREKRDNGCLVAKGRNATLRRPRGPSSGRRDDGRAASPRTRARRRRPGLGAGRAAADGRRLVERRRGGQPRRRRRRPDERARARPLQGAGPESDGAL